MIDEPLISEYSNDPEMGDLIEEFVTGLSGTVAHLRNALAEGDVACVKRIAHQMKGAGGGDGLCAAHLCGKRSRECRSWRSGDHSPRLSPGRKVYRNL